MRNSVLFPLWPLAPFDTAWGVQKRGLWGERAVARKLWKSGHRILEHRWRGPRNTDVDLIAAADGYLLFAEVKVRDARDADPWGDVFARERLRNLRLAVAAYLARTRQQEVAVTCRAYLVVPDPLRPRHPRIEVQEDYLNPRTIPGWRGIVGPGAE